MNTPKIILRNGLAFVLLWSTVSYAQAPSVMFVIDGSGSMWGKADGDSKIEIAKQVMSDMITKLSTDIRMGLMAYGHNRKDDCGDIEILAPVGSDRTAAVNALRGVIPKGKTPLADAVRLAAEQFRQQEGSASVVLVSDGKETCGGDPCAVAREATGTGVDLHIHVVGFDVTPEETEQLECIAKQGKGKYFAADNAAQLVTALAEVEKEVVAPPPPPEPEPQPEPEPIQELLFEDHFDRDELGEMWEIRDPDADRFAMMNGKVLIVPTHPLKNVLVLRKPFSGDFIATVAVTMPLMQSNWASLNYEFDKENSLRAHFYAGGNYTKLCFTKKVSGGEKELCNYGETLGGRDISQPLSNPEDWYLQIERSGINYTARISADGETWTEIGRHVLLKKGDGWFAFQAGSGGGQENTAEFDDFVVNRPR